METVTSGKGIGSAKFNLLADGSLFPTFSQQKRVYSKKRAKEGKRDKCPFKRATWER